MAAVLFAGTWTGCEAYTNYLNSYGVNRYGTSYYVTKTGDTIYRPNTVNTNIYSGYGPQYYSPIYTPTYVVPVVRPRVRRTPKTRTHVPKTSTVRTPRGSRSTPRVSTPKRSSQGSASSGVVIRTNRGRTNSQGRTRKQ